HGDFHLGQMLIVKDDISIIDFEGEPRRSLEDRRRKAPAARDVAGLIRSIDYSATAALERALKSAPDEHGKLAHALEDWREHSVAVFMSAYRSSLSDMRLWPQSIEAADRLLDFFLLEKAFYEIEYELAHRPDWLRVPLAGTWRIFSARLDTAGGSFAGHRCGREITFPLESRESVSDARFCVPTIYPCRSGFHVGSDSRSRVPRYCSRFLL